MILKTFCIYLYIQRISLLVSSIYFIGCAANVTHLGQVEKIAIENVEVSLLENSFNSIQFNEFDNIEFGVTDAANSRVNAVVLVFNESVVRDKKYDNVFLENSEEKSLNLSPKDFSVKNCKHSGNSRQVLRQLVATNNQIIIGQGPKLPSSFLKKNEDKGVCLYSLNVLVSKADNTDYFLGEDLVYSRNITFEQLKVSTFLTGNEAFNLHNFKNYFKDNAKNSKSFEVMESLKSFSKKGQKDLAQFIFDETDMQLTNFEYVRLCDVFDESEKALKLLKNFEHLKYPFETQDIVDALSVVASSERLGLLKGVIKGKKLEHYIDLGEVVKIVAVFAEADRLEALKEISSEVSLLDKEQSDMDSLRELFPETEKENINNIIQNFEYAWSLS